jgi:hypothetical protein
MKISREELLTAKDAEEAAKGAKVCRWKLTTGN